MKIVVAVASVALVSCSAVLTEGPPSDYRRRREFDCSTRRAPAVLDTLLAAGAAANLVAAAAVKQGEYPGMNKGTSLLAGSALLGAYIGSAIFGYVTVNQCRDALWPARAPLPE
jgi:hypothetical protein